MADNIRVTFSATIDNGFFKTSIAPGNTIVDQTGIGRYGHTQAIGTSEEVVDFGDVSTEGWIFLQNLDEDNYVVYGPESSGAMVSFGNLKPGEWAWLRLNPATVLRAKADTAEIMLRVDLFED